MDSFNYQQIRDHFQRRMSYLQKCSHPNIVQFIGVYYPNPNTPIPTIVMEKMDCSLTTFIDQDGPLPLHKALSIMHDVSLGLWYLHSHNPPIMHCDLTPCKVLIVNTNSMMPQAKLGEVGPEDFEANLEILPGPFAFMSPEILQHKPKFGLPSDVFSYGGVVLYAVVGKWSIPTSQVNFDPNTRKRITLSEVERRQQYLDKMIGEAEVLRPLVEECLNDNPDVRPPIEIVSERINQIKINYMGKNPETKVIWCNTYSYCIVTKFGNTSLAPGQ